MKVKRGDYDLFIIGQYPNSLTSQGLINYGEWIISDDESLTEFLRAPCDYANQLKLNILQIYVKKERTTRRAHSAAQTNVYTQLENPTSVGDTRLTHYSNFFDMNASQYIISGNMPSQSSIFDLNETLNESDRDNVMQDQHFVPGDIENGDQANYGELSQSDDSAPNNVDEGECPYDSSSTDDAVRFNSEQRFMSMRPYPQQESIPRTSIQRTPPISQSNNKPRFYSNEILFLDHFEEGPDVLMDMHENAFVPTGVWRERTDFLNDNFFLASQMLFK
ncbi:hypothetical protein FXO38_02285 [Capsicum annuum]|nr:hypothetical protein FXO37_11930 [Capsicum annuum]KAF3680474.1 hypothetical protein FXO38_02285 [Capsicum annuum]